MLLPHNRPPILKLHFQLIFCCIHQVPLLAPILLVALQISVWTYGANTAGVAAVSVVFCVACHVRFVGFAGVGGSPGLAVVVYVFADAGVRCGSRILWLVCSIGTTAAQEAQERQQMLKQSDASRHIIVGCSQATGMDIYA
jgi:hypothetical protein